MSKKIVAGAQIGSIKDLDMQVSSVGEKGSIRCWDEYYKRELGDVGGKEEVNTSNES